MEVQSKTYVLNGVTIREEVCPSMMAIVDTFTPCPSNPPYDVQGWRHVREIKKVLMEVGIESLALVESHTRNNPQGSGPGGAVRFGDSMMPSIYRVVVGKHLAEKAECAIAEHKRQIDLWIEGGELPLACRG
jgi:hypothetical protein